MQFDSWPMAIIKVNVYLHMCLYEQDYRYQILPSEVMQHIGFGNAYVLILHFHFVHRLWGYAVCFEYGTCVFVCKTGGIRLHCDPCLPVAGKVITTAI